MLSFNTNNKEQVVINKTGQVGISTTTFPIDAKLRVAGRLYAQSIKVEIRTDADFVFSNDYELPKLSDIELYGKTGKHLPGIASEKEMQENGVDLGQLNIQLLKKVEELTLHLINLQKQNELILQQNILLKQQSEELDKRIQKLEAQ